MHPNSHHYDYRGRDNRVNETHSIQSKGQFFRSSLKSREQMAFLKKYDRQQNHNLQPNNMNQDFKVRQTLNKPQFLKYVSQTAKNEHRQYNNFFRNDQESKNKSKNTINPNKSEEKRVNDRSHYSPTNYGSRINNKQLNQNVRPQNNEYQRLHDKLNFLQGKISQLNVNLEKWKEEKKSYFEKELKDRKQFDENQWKHSNHNNSPKQPSQHTKQPKVTESLIKQMVTQVSYEKKLKPFSFDPYSPRHNIYYVSEIIRAYKQENSLARQHLLNSIQLLKIMHKSSIPSQSQVNSRMVKLSRKLHHQDKKTVILDLDQTLIHCNQNVNIPSDIKLPIKFPNGEVIQAGINIRPYATQLLKNLSKNFQVIVFTASHSCYANVVINHLDPEGKYVSHRLFREHCFHSPQNVYVKDLRVINRDLSQVVLVDNAAYSYAYQLDNGIPIIPYYEGKMDFELKALQGYIQGMIFSKDVRQINRNTFKLHRYVEFNSPESLVKQLYHQDHK